MAIAWVDLTDVCQDAAGSDWARYLQLRQALLERGGEVRAIGGNSLLHRLSPADRAHLEAAVRHGEVQLVPYADPHLVQHVLADEAATLVSNDRFLALRRVFPTLNGFDRVLGHHIGRRGTSLVPTRFARSAGAELAKAADSETLSRLGYRSDADRDLLQRDWRCPSTRCPVSRLPQLDDLPTCTNGTATCPDCGGRLLQLGPIGDGLEIALTVAGQVRQHVAIAVGLSLTVGRGAAAGDIDIGHLISDVEDAYLVTREHLVITNRDGRLRVRGTGSRGGSRLLRADGDVTLDPRTTVEVRPSERISLAGVVELRICERRWTRAGLLEQRDDLLAAAGA